MDAGDPQVNKMKRYLSAVKNAKKEGQGVIRDIRVLMFKIKRDVDKCTLTQEDLEAIKRGAPNPAFVSYMMSIRKVNLTGNPSCPPRFPRLPSLECKQMIESAKSSSKDAEVRLECIQGKYSYLESIETQLKESCLKWKLTVKENKDIKSAMDTALSIAMAAQERLDQLINHIEDDIKNYKTCIARKKAKTVSVKK